MQNILSFTLFLFKYQSKKPLRLEQMTILRRLDYRRKQKAIKILKGLACKSSIIMRAHLFILFFLRVTQLTRERVRDRTDKNGPRSGLRSIPDPDPGPETIFVPQAGKARPAWHTFLFFRALSRLLRRLRVSRYWDSHQVSLGCASTA